MESPAVIPAELAQHNTEIHIVEANWDLQEYSQFGLASFNIFFLSDTPVEAADIELDLPVEPSYRFELYDVFLGDAPQVLSNDPGAPVRFTYDVYLHYCDFDWSALIDKYRLVQELGKTPPADRTSEDRRKYTEALNDYESFYNMYQAEYQNLTNEMLPQFYCYQIAILLETSEIINDETFNNVTLKIGDKTASVDIGKIQLYAQQCPLSSEEPQGISQYPLAASTPISNLSGTINIPAAGFIADDDIVITGYRFLTGDIEIEQIKVIITSSTGQSSNFTWDGKMPLAVDAGSQVDYGIIITDERMTKCGFDLQGFVQMEHEMDGVVFEHRFLHRIYHDFNPYEEYAKYFDGIDFTEYYEKYYYPIVSGIE